LLATCLGTMTSCAPANAVEPYLPAGECTIPYHLNAGERHSYDCLTIAENWAGLRSDLSVMATVGTGNPAVFGSVVSAANILPWDFIVVQFVLRNDSDVSQQGVALVAAAAAPKKATPAVAAAGVR